MDEFTIRTTNLFHEITCNEGHYITKFKEGDDIMTFQASKIMVCPLSADLTQYHCLTEEEYNVLNEQLNDKIAEEQKRAEEEMEAKRLAERKRAEEEMEAKRLAEMEALIKQHEGKNID